MKRPGWRGEAPCSSSPELARTAQHVLFGSCETARGAPPLRWLWSAEAVTKAWRGQGLVLIQPRFARNCARSLAHATGREANPRPRCSAGRGEISCSNSPGLARRPHRAAFGSCGTAREISPAPREGHLPGRTTPPRSPKRRRAGMRRGESAGKPEEVYFGTRRGLGAPRRPPHPRAAGRLRYDGRKAVVTYLVPKMRSPASPRPGTM